MNGKKPPDEIIVIDKLNESKVLKSIILRHKNRNKVRSEYKINILNNMGINLTNFLSSKSKNKKMKEFQDLDHIDGVSISS